MHVHVLRDVVVVNFLSIRNGFQETEIARLKKKMSKFASCLQVDLMVLRSRPAEPHSGPLPFLQRSQQEHQECLEFLGAERDSLLESTAELESQVHLQEGERVLHAILPPPVLPGCDPSAQSQRERGCSGCCKGADKVCRVG